MTTPSLPENGDMPEVEAAARAICDAWGYMWDDGGRCWKRSRSPIFADRLEQAQELTELKQGIIEAADVRIRELADQLEQAERELDIVRLAASHVEGKVGCGDNSCLFKRPTGMGTNGTGRCRNRIGVMETLANLYRASLPTPKQGDKKP